MFFFKDICFFCYMCILLYLICMTFCSLVNCAINNIHIIKKKFFQKSPIICINTNNKMPPS